MTRTLRPLVKRPLQPSYQALAGQLPLRPFRSEAEYDAATTLLQDLVLREKSLDDGERDYLDTLELLIEAYEDEHYPAEQTHDPIAALKFLLKENGMSVTDLGVLLGSKGTASEILSAKKLISRANAFKLAERFSVEPALFFQPPQRRYPSGPPRA
jgi:HTH-type transcriptional regulator/antitoxin HigA